MFNHVRPVFRKQELPISFVIIKTKVMFKTRAELYGLVCDKSYLGDKALRVYGDSAAESKIFIEFLALVIRNR